MEKLLHARALAVLFADRLHGVVGTPIAGKRVLVVLEKINL